MAASDAEQFAAKGIVAGHLITIPNGKIPGSINDMIMSDTRTVRDEYPTVEMS